MPSVTLTEDPDTYDATNAGDLVFGLGGDDVLTATTGGNRLYGGDGSDTLNGDIGDDYLQGDDDNNFDGLNILNGGGGDDYILSNSNRDVIDAGSGDDADEMSDVGQDQVVEGGSGTDQLLLYAFQTKIVYRLDFSSSFVVKPSIAGELATFNGFESLVFVGGEFLANVLASENSDTIIINNLLSATFNAGSLDGRGGDDTFIINGVTSDFVEQVEGGLGDDQMSWNQGTQALTDVTIDAAGGTMSDDVGQFMAFQSIETLTVNAGNILGHFSYEGMGGVDNVTFNGLTASVRTGSGDDSITVSSGQAHVNAGAGDDHVTTASNPGAKVTVACGGGDDTVNNGSKGTISGDGGNDTLRTTYNRSSLFGDAGDDALTRQVSFNDGRNTDGILDGGAGTDTLTLIFNIVGGTLRTDFSQAVVTLFDGMTVMGCEIVHYTGGFGKDIVTSSNFAGGAAFNLVNGGFGEDRLTAAAAGATLDGGLSNDVLLGGKGNDILIGGLNDDTLNGGGGSDSLNGGAGIDATTGGAGADRFIFTYWGETSTGVTTRDVITDFSRTDGDRIDLALMDANINTVGVDEGFTFRGAKAFTHTAGELRFEQVDNAGTDNDYTLVTGDVNGTGNATFSIQLNGLIDLKASDFIL